ncbi:MAG TPA: winged helix-turn-helix domain-containing protein [Steroidobacteraceae bacterium]|nr:winged helix-turn-helix domain-containing protein [Steroidobacteraceae bacterium]
MTTTSSERGDTTSAVYAFDAFEFDPQRRLLRCHGSERRLTARAHDVLLYLIERRGQLALKTQLLDAVWRGVVVEESSLTQAIHELRSVLGEKPRDRRYILTVPGRGYQFVAEVRVLDRSEPRIEPPPALVPRGRASGDAAPMVAASLAIVAAWGMAALVLLWPSRIETGPAAPSLAEMRAAEARFFLARRGPGDLDRAEASAHAALKAEPGLAKAWSSLAGVHAIRGTQDAHSRTAELRRMRDAAERALRLDPNDAQALVRLSNFHCSNGDKKKARELLAAAAKAAPDDPLVLSVQAGQEAWHGRFDAAVRLQRFAVRNAPVSAVDRINLAHYLFIAGRLDEAREHYRGVLGLVSADHDSPLARDAYVGIARIDVAMGRPDEARAIAASMPAGLDRDFALALIEHAARDRAAADAALERVRAQATEENAYLLAEIHAFRGELDAAFHWLAVGSRAMAALPELQRDRNWDVRTSPLLAEARHDPRWQDWLAANL